MLRIQPISHVQMLCMFFLVYSLVTSTEQPSIVEPKKTFYVCLRYKCVVETGERGCAASLNLFSRYHPQYEYTAEFDSLSPGPHWTICSKSPMRTMGWIISDNNHYLDCSSALAIIDLATLSNQHTFCLSHWPLQSSWISLLGNLKEHSHRPVTCEINRIPFKFSEAVLTFHSLQDATVGGTNIQCDEGRFSKRIYFIRSPKEIFYLWKSVPTHYFWIKKADIRFKFRILNDKAEESLPCQCEMLTPTGWGERLPDGILRSDVQHDPGSYKVSCVNIEYGLSKTITIRLVPRDDCVLTCADRPLIVQKPIDKPSEIVLCSCGARFQKKYVVKSEQFDLLTEYLDCESDHAHQLNVTGNIIRLHPSGIYPRLSLIECKLCSTEEKDCESEQIVLAIEDPPKRILTVDAIKNQWYQATHHIPQIIPCLRWSDEEDCDTKAGAIFQLSCRLTSKISIVTGLHYATCVSGLLNRTSIVGVPLYNASNVPMTCLTGPLVITWKQGPVIQLCSPSADLPLPLPVSKDVKCKSVSPGLTIKKNQLIVSDVNSFNSYHVVICENQAAQPIHIFAERPPEHMLKVRVNEKFLLFPYEMKFSTCIYWTSSKQCDDLATKLLGYHCGIVSRSEKSNNAIIQCEIQATGRQENLSIPVIDLRLLKTECIDNMTVYDLTNKLTTVPVCYWKKGTNLPENYTAVLPQLVINCNSSPPGLVLDNGNWLINEIDQIKTGRYMVKCDKTPFPVIFYCVDDSVQLMSKPNNAFYIFGRKSHIEYTMAYPEYITSVPIELGQLRCSISAADRDKETDSALKFDQGNRLIIGNMEKTNSHRGKHVVRCRDRFTERRKAVYIYHSTDFSLLILEKFTPIIHSESQQTLTCVLRSEILGSHVHHPRVRWLRNTTGSLVLQKDNVLLIDRMTPTATYQPRCDVNIDGMHLYIDLKFIVYSESQMIVLRREPRETITVVEGDELLVVRLVWSRVGMGIDQELLDQQLRKCEAIVEFRNGTEYRFSFENYYPFRQIPSGLLRLYCSCQLPDCMAHFSSLVVRKKDLNLVCRKRIVVDLEEGEARIMICEYRFEVLPDLAAELSVPRVVRKPAECIDPMGELQIVNGVLIVALPYPLLGEYNVSCADGDRWIPVFIHHQSVMLIAKPPQQFYLFSENSSVSFQFVYVDSDTDAMKQIRETDIRCNIQAPKHWDWKKISSPYQFHGNRLYLNTSVNYRVSARYRVQCTALRGILDRSVELQIINSSSLVLVIRGPDVRHHTPSTPGTYSCILLTKPGLDISSARTNTFWRIIQGDYVHISKHVVQVDETTSSGVHLLECVYENSGVRLNRLLNFTFFRPQNELQIKIHPDEDPIAINQHKTLNASLNWLYLDANETEVVLPEPVLYCTLTYLVNCKHTIVLNFTREIAIDSFEPGVIEIKCHSTTGAYSVAANRTLIKKAQFTKHCIDQRLINVEKLTSLVVCSYHVDISISPEHLTKVHCHSLDNALRFQEGVLLLDTEPKPLGYYDVICGDQEFNATFFFYDRSFVIQPEPMLQYYIVNIHGTVRFNFGFIRASKFAPLKMRAESNCSFLNPELSQVQFEGMGFQLSQVKTVVDHLMATVVCSTHGGQLTRYHRIALLKQNSFYLHIEGPERTVYLRNQSVVFTCLLYNRLITLKPEEQNEPRWISEHTNIKSIGNRLLIDRETEIGVHNVICVYSSIHLKLRTNRTYLVCDNIGINMTLQPESIILSESSGDFVRADLHWDCPIHEMHDNSSFRIECNVTYRWPPNVKPIQFIDQLPHSLLQAGFARFTCSNNDSHFSQNFDRRILDTREFITNCVQSKIITIGQQSHMVHELCRRELHRVEPWISTIAESEWPCLPVNCTDNSHTLPITDGKLNLITKRPPAGFYEVTCEGWNGSTSVYILDSTVRLATLPKQIFFLLDGKVQPSFVFQSYDGLSNAKILPVRDMTCQMTTVPSVDTFGAEAPKHPTIFLDSSQLGKFSSIQTVQCKALNGSLTREMPLYVIAPDEVELNIIGSNHVIHEQDKSFYYFCEVMKPEIISSLVRPQWIPPYPNGVVINGTRAMLTRGMKEGVHKLSCALNENGISITKGIEFVVVEPNIEGKYLTLFTESSRLYKYGTQIPPALCKPSGNMEKAHVVWRRMHGKDNYAIARQESQSGATLIIKNENSYFGPSSFVCQAKEKDMCYSKLFIYYRSGGTNSISIVDQIRTQFFNRPLICSSYAWPPELNRYQWTILLSDPVRWTVDRGRITVHGTDRDLIRSYKRCQVDQLYLGRVYSSNSTTFFSQIKYKAEMLFIPQLSVYHAALNLICRVSDSEYYSSIPYMIIKSHPRGFRPHTYYETIDFSQGFVGGVYRVACYYINSNFVRLEKHLRFEFHEAPTNVTIHQIRKVNADGRTEFGFQCRPNGYPPTVSNVSWTVIDGPKFAFLQQKHQFLLTAFAPYGHYRLHCQVIVDYEDTAIQMNATSDFIYQEQPHVVFEHTECSANINIIMPILITMLCWTAFYLHICFMFTTVSPVTFQVEEDFDLSQNYIIYDTSNLGRHVGSQFRAMVRNFDTIQQILEQVASHKRITKMGAVKQRAELEKMKARLTRSKRKRRPYSDRLRRARRTVFR